MTCWSKEEGYQENSDQKVASAHVSLWRGMLLHLLLHELQPERVKCLYSLMAEGRPSPSELHIQIAVKTQVQLTPRGR